MVGLITCTPQASPFYSRSTAVLSHFSENWKESSEREVFVAALSEANDEELGREKNKKMSKNKSTVSLFKGSRCIMFFFYFYSVLQVVLWSTTAIGPICMSHAQLAEKH